MPLIFQGVAYSLYAAVIWPSVPLTVKPSCTGTAYGAITSIQNIGLAVFPLIIALIYNTSGSYIPNVEIFFVSLATVGVGIGVLLNFYDIQSEGKLNAVVTNSEEQYADRDRVGFISSLSLEGNGNL